MINFAIYLSGTPNLTDEGLLSNIEQRLQAYKGSLNKDCKFSQGSMEYSASVLLESDFTSFKQIDVPELIQTYPGLKIEFGN